MLVCCAPPSIGRHTRFVNTVASLFSRGRAFNLLARLHLGLHSPYANQLHLILTQEPRLGYTSFEAATDLQRDLNTQMRRSRNKP
jgi:hypothetical protein